MTFNWINIKDREPRKGQYVVSLDRSGMFATEGYDKEECAFWCVTHWMALPPFPDDFVPYAPNEYFIPYGGEGEEGDDSCDEHLACGAYPDCDESPLGCRVRHGNNAEHYGHRG